MTDLSSYSHERLQEMFAIENSQRKKAEARLAQALSERDRLLEAILRHRADYLKDGVSHDRDLWDTAQAIQSGEDSG